MEMYLSRIFHALMIGLLFFSGHTVSADMLVFSGATYRSMGCCASFTLPDRRLFRASELYRLDVVDVKAEDAVIYDLTARDFQLYRSITPYDLLNSHPRLAVYDLATDLALRREQSLLFSLNPSSAEINAPLSFIYIGRLPYGEWLNIGRDYLRPGAFWLLMLPAIISK